MSLNDCIPYNKEILSEFVSVEFMIELEELGVDTTDGKYILCENEKREKFITTKHNCLTIACLFGGIFPLITIYKHKEVLKHFRKRKNKSIEQEKLKYLKGIFESHIV